MAEGDEKNPYEGYVEHPLGASNVMASRVNGQTGSASEALMAEILLLHEERLKQHGQVNPRANHRFFVEAVRLALIGINAPEAKLSNHAESWVITAIQSKVKSKSADRRDSGRSPSSPSTPRPQKDNPYTSFVNSIAAGGPENRKTRITEVAQQMAGRVLHTRGQRMDTFKTEVVSLYQAIVDSPLPHTQHYPTTLQVVDQAATLVNKQKRGNPGDIIHMPYKIVEHAQTKVRSGPPSKIQSSPPRRTDPEDQGPTRRAEPPPTPTPPVDVKRPIGKILGPNHFLIDEANGLSEKYEIKSYGGDETHSILHRDATILSIELTRKESDQNPEIVVKNRNGRVIPDLKPDLSQVPPGALDFLAPLIIKEDTDGGLKVFLRRKDDEPGEGVPVLTLDPLLEWGHESFPLDVTKQYDMTMVHQVRYRNRTVLTMDKSSEHPGLRFELGYDRHKRNPTLVITDAEGKDLPGGVSDMAFFAGQEVNPANALAIRDYTSSWDDTKLLFQTITGDKRGIPLKPFFDHIRGRDEQADLLKKAPPALDPEDGEKFEYQATQFGDPEGDPLTIKGVHKSGYPSADLHRVFQGEEEKFRVEVHYRTVENTLVVVRDPDQKILKVIDTGIWADISRQRRHPGSPSLKSHEINRIKTWDGKPRLRLQQTIAEEGHTSTPTKYVSLEEFLQKQEQKFEYVVDEQQGLKVRGVVERGGREVHTLECGGKTVLKASVRREGSNSIYFAIGNPDWDYLDFGELGGFTQIGKSIGGLDRLAVIQKTGGEYSFSAFLSRDNGPVTARELRDITQFVEQGLEKIKATEGESQPFEYVVDEEKGLRVEGKRNEAAGTEEHSLMKGKDLVCKLRLKVDRERDRILTSNLSDHFGREITHWHSGSFLGEFGGVVDGQRLFGLIRKGEKEGVIEACEVFTGQSGRVEISPSHDIAGYVQRRLEQLEEGSHQKTSEKGLPERAQRPEGDGPWKFEYKVGDFNVKVVHDPDAEMEYHTVCQGDQELLVLRASCLKKKIWQKTTDVEVFDASDKEMNNRLKLGTSWKDLDYDGGQWMRVVEKDGQYNVVAFALNAEGEVIPDVALVQVKDPLDLTPHLKKAGADFRRLEETPPPIDLENGKKSSYKVKAGEAGAEVTFDVQVAQQQDENGGLREAHCISRMGEELLRVEVRDQDEAARKANI
ncbi:MAG: hypothetical protein ABH950_06005, partial [Candidatus Altiarchaeota archaeon]